MKHREVTYLTQGHTASTQMEQREPFILSIIKRHRRHPLLQTGKPKLRLLKDLARPGRCSSGTWLPIETLPRTFPKPGCKQPPLASSGKEAAPGGELAWGLASRIYVLSGVDSLAAV